MKTHLEAAQALPRPGQTLGSARWQGLCQPRTLLGDSLPFLSEGEKGTDSLGYRGFPRP